MRQLVALLNAADERSCRKWYSELCLHAQVNGATVERSFEELFPGYTDASEDDDLSISPEAAKLMEKLEREQLERANKQYVERERTFNSN